MCIFDGKPHVDSLSIQIITDHVQYGDAMLFSNTTGVVLASFDTMCWDMKPLSCMLLT